MKESRFNRYIYMPDGQILVFNSLSCGLAIIDNTYKEILSLLPNINHNDLTDNQIKTYTEAKVGGFLIDDEFDELLDFRIKRNVDKYNITNLNLTIAPTLLCNFNCIYCYEENKSGSISENTENNIVKFIFERRDILRNINIDWYGGEPLLSFDKISSLSKKFLTLCKENNINYTSTIVTNGSLINDDIIYDLKQYKINDVQITLDGPPRIHEKRRKSKNNNINFFTIVDNINKVLSKDIRVIIRINIDKTNEIYLDELFYILDNNLSGKVDISFGQVQPITSFCNSISGSCFNNSEFAKNLLNYYSLLFKYDFVNEKEFPYPYAKYNYCSSEILNSYVIDPEGFLYKCWNLIGNKNYSIGNINDEHLDINSYVHGKWICNKNINKNCTNCDILPLCLGGCPMLNKKNNSINCDTIKYNIDDIFLKYYNQLKEV